MRKLLDMLFLGDILQFNEADRKMFDSNTMLRFFSVDELAVVKAGGAYADRAICL